MIILKCNSIVKLRFYSIDIGLLQKDNSNIGPYCSFDPCSIEYLKFQYRLVLII